MIRFAFIGAVALVVGCSRDEAATAEDAETDAPGATDRIAEPSQEQAVFRYTSLADCTLIRSAPEEAGFFEHECPGEGGYRLRKTESDLRENIVLLVPGGGEYNLGLPALANGAFSSVGDSVEWRGETDRGSFAPHALIVRQSVMEDPDPAVPEVSYLVVTKLGARPCVVARIQPGPDQNERARRAVDFVGECLDTSG
jgi:hypothetical protein